jgi:hypothetical protein
MAAIDPAGRIRHFQKMRAVFEWGLEIMGRGGGARSFPELVAGVSQFEFSCPLFLVVLKWRGQAKRTRDEARDRTNYLHHDVCSLGPDVTLADRL